MRVIFHRQAQSEIISILQYYKEIASPETAREFLSELRVYVNRIAQRPESFAVVSPVLRRANLKRFPYHLLFYCIESQIKVVAVVHNHRHPSVGTKRR